MPARQAHRAHQAAHQQAHQQPGGPLPHLFLGSMQLHLQPGALQQNTSRAAAGSSSQRHAQASHLHGGLLQLLLPCFQLGPQPNLLLPPCFPLSLKLLLLSRSLQAEVRQQRSIEGLWQLLFTKNCCCCLLPAGASTDRHTEHAAAAAASHLVGLLLQLL